MLGDIMLQRARLGTHRLDLHSYATFNCRWAKIVRRVKELFS